MNVLPGQEIPLFKIPLLGDPSVGKTCIVEQMLNGKFLNNSKPNVGVLTTQIQVQLLNRIIPLSIWDTAGQETYRSLVPLYTRNSSAILLVFDLSNKLTFLNIPKWLKYIRGELNLNCPIFLCANKIDTDFTISIEEIKSFGSEFQCEVFFTSALTGEGIKDLLQAIACSVIDNSPNSKFGNSPNLNQNNKSCC